MNERSADTMEITAILKRINHAWLHPDGAPIAPRIIDAFRHNTVIVGPDLQRVARGAAAAAGSYDEFVKNARILDAALDDPEVDVDGDVAIATLRWRMRYCFSENEFAEHGHEVYVLVRANGRWQISWRQTISAPAPPLSEA